MAKKGLLILVLASVVGGGVFAASDPNWAGRMFNFNSGPTVQKGALFVDLGYTFSYLFIGGFGIGAGWEQRVNRNWTWVVNGAIGLYGNDNIYHGKYSAFDFSAEINGRYYFFGSALDKLFVNAGLGFGYYSWSYSYDDPAYGTNKTYGWGSFNIPLYAGWKFIIGPGFVAEFDLGYRIGIGLFAPGDYNSAYSTPTYGGFIAGLRLGWAF